MGLPADFHACPAVAVASFKLLQRATHVYSEAGRVLQFKEVCEGQPEDALQQLGKLMDDSHASCRDMYECSHPEVDALVQTCKYVIIVVIISALSKARYPSTPGISALYEHCETPIKYNGLIKSVYLIINIPNKN